MDIQQIDRQIERLQQSLQQPPPRTYPGPLRVGLDLGTYATVLVVLDAENTPLVCEMEQTQALRDGVVVDYLAACEAVQRLKAKAEQRLQCELTSCALAMPPGTEASDGRTHCYVAASAGLEVSALIDEPSAANLVLNMRDGAIVDIGGGTTGIAVLQQGKVVHVADWPTGGIHISLVLAGAKKIAIAEADRYKLNQANHPEILGLTTPVIEKMGQIVLDEIIGYAVQNICLVGGACCLGGLKEVFQRYTKHTVIQPLNPLLVTPLGIAYAHLT